MLLKKGGLLLNWKLMCKDPKNFKVHNALRFECESLNVKWSTIHFGRATNFSLKKTAKKGYHPARFSLFLDPKQMTLFSKALSFQPTKHTKQTNQPTAASFALRLTSPLGQVPKLPRLTRRPSWPEKKDPSHLKGHPPCVSAAFDFFSEEVPGDSKWPFWDG